MGLKLHLTAVERRRISPDSSRALSLYTFKNMAPQSHYPRLWRCKGSNSTSHSTAQRGCVASPRSVQNPKKIKKLKKSNKQAKKKEGGVGVLHIYRRAREALQWKGNRAVAENGRHSIPRSCLSRSSGAPTETGAAAVAVSHGSGPFGEPKSAAGMGGGGGGYLISSLSPPRQGRGENNLPGADMRLVLQLVHKC